MWLRLNRRQFFKAGVAGSAVAAYLSSPNRRNVSAKTESQVNNLELPFRQIHLDFHTSHLIKDVAAQFDPDDFADTLVKAHVNSINCFGRCHHGFIYYDTQAFPDRRHPHLTRNILNEQIEACHQRGIRVPIYITIQWDYYTATRHPEWMIRKPDGSHYGEPLDQPGFYQNLCVNSPYGDFIKKMLRDLFERVPVDGVWLDIVKVYPCTCQWCTKDMQREGLNPELEADQLKFAQEMMTAWKADTTRLIESLDRHATIFYNGGHIGPEIRQSIDSYTHLEMESLPSSGYWGYLHFPTTARFVRTLGKEHLGMTGKFHTAWGDFHSFKNQAALQFECYQTLALGSKCCVGDQLHPNGAIDPTTYDLIGSVYEEVEKKEPWCMRAKPVAEIAVFTPEEFIEDKTPPAAQGAVRILQEGGHQFNMVDTHSSLAEYKVVILPDIIPVNETLKTKLEDFVANGGSLIATFESGLDRDKNQFVLDLLGVKKISDGPKDKNGELVRGRVYKRSEFAEYIIPTGSIGEGLKPTEYVMYMRGLDVKANGSAEILAPITRSYFDRVGTQFSSHQQTPSSGKTAGAAIVKNGRCIYFSHPLFEQYDTNAPLWCKKMFLNALAILLPEPLVKIEAPSSTLVTLNEQPDKKRYILHLLHYVPERRGTEIDTIEDVIPIHDIAISLGLEKTVEGIRTVPEKQKLPFKRKDKRIEFNLPKLNGHQMIEIST